MDDSKPLTSLTKLPAKALAQMVVQITVVAIKLQETFLLLTFYPVNVHPKALVSINKTLKNGHRDPRSYHLMSYGRLWLWHNATSSQHRWIHGSPSLPYNYNQNAASHLKITQTMRSNSIHLVTTTWILDIGCFWICLIWICDDDLC